MIDKRESLREKGQLLQEKRI
jgi:hypothetical protein